jgi:CubicO group peptidase (beta-lactamase class C family)
MFSKLSSQPLTRVLTRFLATPKPAIDPALASPQVLKGFDAAGAPQLRPAKQPITLRHLLTHTAGFQAHMQRV